MLAEQPEAESKKLIADVISGLTDRYGRQPTEDEVFDFIFGDNAQRIAIWNKEVDNELDR